LAGGSRGRTMRVLAAMRGSVGEPVLTTAVVKQQFDHGARAGRALADGDCGPRNGVLAGAAPPLRRRPCVAPSEGRRACSAFLGGSGIEMFSHP
jgi:hypothetical protein